MSLHHASSDPAGTDEAEQQQSHAETPTASSVPSRQRFPLNIRQVARTGGMVALGMSVLFSLVAVVMMSGKISDLTIRVNSLDAAFRNGQIGQLTSNVAAMEARLKALEGLSAEMVKMKADLGSDAATVQALRQELTQLRDAGNGSQQDIVQLSNRLGSLEHSVQQSATALEAVNHQLSQKSADPEKAKTAPSQPATSPAKATPSAKKIKRSVRRTATPAAPFVMTGIEHRGGQTFAVVIPRGVSQIASVRLLSVGDGIDGWTLRDLEGNRSALFVVNGREYRLFIQ
ncbi:plasmid transfer protein [Erwinia psidii]|uniref:Plasmid transfer protein n=1 Tax=Erwinia psidii TaxID=69224 RepID=A0A3N6SGS4_9GAMM|nr:plasmid transfer protein [Erwinia psidii]MCX8957033.1 plasmid transfer protein [Erwinia psidii]MCX8965291.1 plasmid transfer protein [Erwinia psidii]RQM37911.1 plasmid transfer protein [Erwinia psidii]